MREHKITKFERILKNLECQKIALVSASIEDPVIAKNQHIAASATNDIEEEKDSGEACELNDDELEEELDRLK